MNYKDAFAIDEKSYFLRKKDNETTPINYLKNYDDYDQKLEEDFYLRYIIKELLFDVPIHNLNEFILFQYNNCQSPDDFLDVLENDVIPALADIVENAQFSMTGNGYYNEVVLEDGFIETEGVIKHPLYELSHFYHLVAFHKNRNQISRRIDIVKNFLKEINDVEENKIGAPLKWIAKPSQLAIIIRELIDQGYMEADEKNGEVNCAKLARELLQAFSISEGDSIKTIEIYLSPGNKRYSQAKEEFEKRNFLIPPAKFT